MLLWLIRWCLRRLLLLLLRCLKSKKLILLLLSKNLNLLLRKNLITSITSRLIIKNGEQLMRISSIQWEIDLILKSVLDRGMLLRICMRECLMSSSVVGKVTGRSWRRTWWRTWGERRSPLWRFPDDVVFNEMTRGFFSVLNEIFSIFLNNLRIKGFVVSIDHFIVNVLVYCMSSRHRLQRSWHG